MTFTGSETRLDAIQLLFRVLRAVAQPTQTKERKCTHPAYQMLRARRAVQELDANTVTGTRKPEFRGKQLGCLFTLV